MSINEYVKQVKQGITNGISTEHSYRPALQFLFSSLIKGIIITNEPKRQKCGAPDFIIQRKEVPVGYIEAKDIGENLRNPKKSDLEQKTRYLASLDNIIFTDYLEFHFYRNGQKVKEIAIASMQDGKFKIHSENFSSFETYIKDFCDFNGQTIKSAEKLAKMMAQKARMMEEVIFNAVLEDDDNNTLNEQLKAFQQILIHDLDEKTFADIYSQTIAYGLFAARLHDKTLETFSRQEARELIPRSNPFLRNLFDYVSGAQLDDRVVWIVDDLAEIFRATDLKAILNDFGKSTGFTDPFLHFYETFLAEYDPKLRKSRGVYYTPEPVVNFIVRAVDDLLKAEFKLSDGIGDKSKIKLKIDDENSGKKIEKQIHRIQILDPATGTGTFLSETVKHIYRKFEGQQGIWSNYVEENLIPRLNGFEILMASYTMCHLKLEMLLAETGYIPKEINKQKRLRVFLTNSLEEAHPETGTLFASWLSKESTEANYIKRDTPVMCVIGNPPYANFGKMNQGEWIRNLISDYKIGLNEKKINLDDDYIKFIRYGQYFIEKNGEGILAFITNNSFIDGITHRQMRKSIIASFDNIYIIDLHGNISKKEKDPNGGIDENIFDIQQGVSINIFTKSRNSKKFIKHFDLFGKREDKYSFLEKNNIQSIKWNNIKPDNDNCFFTNKDLKTGSDYLGFISLPELIPLYNSGIQTKRDSIAIQFSENDARQVIDDFRNLSNDNITTKYSLPPDGRDWQIEFARNDILNCKPIIQKEQYRPFDFRYSFYTGNSKGIVAYPRQIVSKHFINKDNVGLCLMRQFFQDAPFSHILVTDKMIDERTMYSNRGGTYLFPLYIYLDNHGQQTMELTEVKISNLRLDIINQIASNLGLTFTDKQVKSKGRFTPIDILDYVYAVLHSPSYREKYKEFLKIDFPRVPIPKNEKYFWGLIKQGSLLREIHLLESPIVEKRITSYPVTGNNKVENIKFKNNKIWINESQYFDKVPEALWHFYIGGYQPAQKWLKDRKNRELNSDEILHYQKIIVILAETKKIMTVIDEIIDL